MHGYSTSLRIGTEDLMTSKIEQPLRPMCSESAGCLEPLRKSQASASKETGRWSAPSALRMTKHLSAYSLAHDTMQQLKRPLIAIMLLISSALLFWTLTMSDTTKETPVIHMGSEDGSQSVSINYVQGGEFADVESLVESLQVSSQSNELTMVDRVKEKRLIFIGDIHGCLEELKKLLKKVDYDHKVDHIIVTGDIVNKGPDSTGAIDFLRKNKASCVRGNHDDSVLRKVRTLDENLESQLEALSLDSAVNAEWHLARKLSSEQVAYLRACPIILRVGKIASCEIVVVHGGLVPSVPLKHQNPHHVMNMRIIDATTLEPSKKHSAEGAVAWSQLWNEYQDMSLEQRTSFARNNYEVDDTVTTVIYGHDAKSGLKIKKHTKGLDSACVVGGKLTALVIDQHGVEEIVQVKCKKHHHS